MMAYTCKDYDPNTQYVAWNGDIRDKPTRWNGASDMEDQGFMSRGIHSISQPPPEEPPAPPKKLANRTIARSLQTVPTSMNYSPWSKPPKDTRVREPEIKRAEKRSQ